MFEWLLGEKRVTKVISMPHLPKDTILVSHDVAQKIQKHVKEGTISEECLSMLYNSARNFKEGKFGHALDMDKINKILGERDGTD